jgi:cell fate (sporulation/competence/biofilm development) regulator YlbF (YheA/YmcA/DUF963 family)
VIPDKARELGRLIGQSDEYGALKRAQDGVSEAKELREKLDKLRQLADALERSAAEGNQPGEKEVAAYDELLTSIQGDPRYQSVVAAQTNFDKLMIKVNDQIMDGIRKGAASPIITLG